MRTCSPTILALAAATLGLCSVGLIHANGNHAMPPAFLDDFDDDALGAMPWNAGGRFDPAIETEIGEVLVTGPVDPRAIVEVVDVVGPGGHLERVLRVSDAQIHTPVGHSEVTMRPIGAVGMVSLRFSIRLSKLAGDIVKLSVTDNRTTPGTGRLASVEVAPSGNLVVQGNELPFVVEPGVKYHVTADFDLSGPQDTLGLHVVPAGGGPSFHQTGVQLPIDGAMVTDVTFGLADGGKGAFDLDNVRVLVMSP